MKTLRRNGLKGQEALSPGQRLKGQKLYLVHSAFALSGRWLRVTFTQGDALGWEHSGLSGRSFGSNRPQVERRPSSPSFRKLN